MDKKIVKHVMERSQGYCEVCQGTGTELHHIIFGSGKRKACENKQSVILLCMQCHRGTNGVHGKNGHKLNIELKMKLQNYYFSKGLDEQEVRKLMGGSLYEY